MNGNTHRKQNPVLAAFAVAAALCLALAPVAAAQDVAQVRAGSAGIDFQPVVEHGGLVLTVSGPDGFHHRAEFGTGESPSFSIFDQAGGVLPDGSYKYELRVTPTNTQRREALEANQIATRSGTPKGIESLVQSGSFAVLGGSVVAEGASEPGAEGGSTQAPTGGNRLATKDFVINDDLIVTGSACIGFDCVNGESFGFDTIRLKENNLRIKFDDTSTVAGFPNADWQLTANDSTSGGLNKFSIEQTSAGLVPFTVEGGASNNSLYVDTALRVGIGTSTPVLNLHVSTGNTPSLRLEQNTSAGFSAQTFDVAGNEANFFVRDVTGGSTLPFRIRPGAPTSSLDIAASGNVGIGTASPSASLHVSRSNGTAQVLVTETNGTSDQRTLLRLENNGPPALTFQNNAATGSWSFFHANNDRFVISRDGSGTQEFAVASNGDILVAGAVVHSSSRELKTDFESLDPAEILARLEAIPVQTWRYKRDEETTRHLGPVAEDFHAAFGLGTDARHIALNDAVGVAMAAVQGLSQAVRERDGEIEELKRQVEVLRQAVQEIGPRSDEGDR